MTSTDNGAVAKQQEHNASSKTDIEVGCQQERTLGFSGDTNHVANANPIREHRTQRGVTIQFGSISHIIPGGLSREEKPDNISNGVEQHSQMSSTGDKAPSIGGKSTVSAVTFALDEKESLRPDDSASIAAAAVEDEENHAEVARKTESSNGSNEDVRAFREQLNEISTIDPLRRATITGIDQNGTPGQGVLYVPPVDDHIAPSSLASQEPYEAPPDLKLLEALENPRDRIWVLKLEQDVIDFVKDAKESSLVLPQCNSFYRMLAHKIADYYMLGHSVDDSNSAVRLFKTAACRIVRPLTGVVTPSTAASTPPPNIQMKILRRAIGNGPAIANGSNLPSKSTSETGDSEDDPRKPATREEREARYEAARLRIMGAAKPAEGDLGKDNVESRSSSVSRKGRKGKRDDSDDDFEARSAYNSYVTPGYGQNTAYAVSQPQPFVPQQHYGQIPAYPQYSPQMHNGQYWYPTQEAEWSNWGQPPANHFDVAREFDRSMSLQPASPMTFSAPQSPFTPSYQNSLNAAHGWATAPHGQPYSDRPASANQAPTYAYGQLPSEALGRPPNALEHPLPGSYKSRHFNPQSQTFIPGPFRPFLPQRTMSGPNVGMPMGPGPIELQRQVSSQSQGSHINTPQHGNISSRLPSQPLIHPLPQPVFPLHNPPSMKLPAKPSLAQQYSYTGAHPPVAPISSAKEEESIAKWGTPASLPPKPPSADKHDAKILSMQRPIQAGSIALSFGSVPASEGV